MTERKKICIIKTIKNTILRNITFVKKKKKKTIIHFITCSCQCYDGGSPIYSKNKIDRHIITEILLKLDNQE